MYEWVRRRTRARHAEAVARTFNGGAGRTAEGASVHLALSRVPRMRADGSGFLYVLYASENTFGAEAAELVEA